MRPIQILRPNGVKIETVALMGLWLALTVASLVGSIANADFGIALYGCLACLVVTAPALMRSFEWISPWSMVMLAVYVGCGVRGFAILDAGLTDPKVIQFYTRGREIGDFLESAMLVLLGFIMLALGYAVEGKRGAPNSSLRCYSFGGAVGLVVVLCSVAGLYGFWRYAQGTGGFDLAHLSAKRAAYYGQASYSGGQGQWRAINQLSTLALLIVVARNAVRPGGASLLGRYVVLPAMFLNAALLPIYSSTRSQVILIIMQALVVYASLRPVKRSLVIRLGALALVLLALLTLSRQQSEGKEAGFSAGVAVRAISDAAVLNLNFTEIPKAVNVIEAVRTGQLEVNRGETILNYMVAPIPRSLWPGKPIVDPGVEVGVRVYATDGSAVPPGVVAESYWAFGAVGLVVLNFGTGWLMRRLHNRYRPRRGDDVGRGLVFATVVFPFGYNAVSGSLGYALMASAIWAIMVWGALVAAGRWERETPTSCGQIGDPQSDGTAPDSLEVHCAHRAD